MKIFTNESLQENRVDYSRWETFNGDYVTITNVGSGYIERSIDMLEQYMQRYPNHVNCPIWQRYIKAFEDEVTKRESFVKEQRHHTEERDTFYQTASAIM